MGHRKHAVESRADTDQRESVSREFRLSGLALLFDDAARSALENALESADPLELSSAFGITDRLLGGVPHVAHRARQVRLICAERVNGR